MEIITNELSFNQPANDIYVARQMMQIFIDLVRQVHRAGCERTLRISRGMIAVGLTSSYSLQHWLNDHEVDYDLRLFFRSIGTKAPYLDEIYNHELINNQIDLFCEFDGETGLGFTVAYLIEGPVVSFSSAERYRTDPVLVRVVVAEEDDIHEFSQEICNLFNVRQFLDRRLTWLEQRIARERDISTGHELLAKSEQRFSRLVFCRESIKFISKFSGKEPFFDQIIRHLQVLQNSLEEWTTGAFEPVGVRSSGESESTMNNPELKELRNFICPDNIYRLMPRHTKIMGANIRIHFLEIIANKSAYIGYIGKHLPVSSSAH